MALNIEPHIRDVPDFPKKGIIFKDITPVLQSPDLFDKIIQYRSAADNTARAAAKLHALIHITLLSERV